MCETSIVIDGNAFTTIATCIGAIAAVYAAFIANKIGQSANLIARYETKRKIVQEIYDLFEEAKNKFYIQEFYKTSEPELLITKALNKANLFGFDEIGVHLDNIRQNLLKGHEAYSLQTIQEGNECTKIIFAKKVELDKLFTNIAAFKKIFRIKEKR